jgi:thioesterase domain-containing protein
VSEAATAGSRAAPAPLSFEPLLTIAAGPAAAAPLFCVHPAAGVGWEYASLAPHLGADRALFALQAPWLEARGELPDSVETIARDYLRRVRAVAPCGPYHLLGWSFGGAVAHAMATALQADGERVGMLAILDWYPYDPGHARDEPTEHEYLLTLLENLGRDRRDVLAQAGSPLSPDGARRVLLQRGHALERLEDERLEAILEVFLHHVSLRARHVPRLFDGDLLFVKAAAEPCATAGRAGARDPASWRPFVTGRIAEHGLEAEHRGMLRRGPAAQLAPLLAAALAAADDHQGTRTHA